MKKKILISAVFIILLVILLGFFFFRTSKTEEQVLNNFGTYSIQCRLDVIHSFFNCKAFLQLKNNSTKPFRILNANFPVNGKTESEIFEVTKNMKRIPYVGLEIKRPSKFYNSITIEPNGTLETTVDLCSTYLMYMPGTYSVKYSIINFENGETSIIKSNEVMVKIP